MVKKILFYKFRKMGFGQLRIRVNTIRAIGNSGHCESGNWESDLVIRNRAVGFIFT